MSYMDVASYTQLLGTFNDIDYRDYVRRVSKYDIDRRTVDFQRLKKEKEKDRTDNVKIKRDELDEKTIQQKSEEVAITQQKINSLASIKAKQDRERREFLRNHQDAFRRAIEERT